MSEQIDELRRIMAVATDVAMASKIRMQAIEHIGRMRTHEALEALLSLAANDRITKKEREMALKYAGGIIRALPE